MEIRRVEHEDALGEIICQLRQDAKLVRLDGWMGVGKTLFGKQLFSHLDAAFFDGDDFVSPSDDERAYVDCVRTEEIRSAIFNALNARRVVFAAVCSQEIVPRNCNVIEFAVYLKRMSFSTPEWPYWHHNPDTEDAPARALERSVHDYHLKYRPHEASDLILEIPEEGHTLNGTNFG